MKPVKSGSPNRSASAAIGLLAGVIGLCAPAFDAAEAPRTIASSSQAEFGPSGALEGDRFSAAAGHAWKGSGAASNWWWEVRFAAARDVGAILQIQGDHDFVFTNAPLAYVWQSSLDGQSWQRLQGTQTGSEARTFRLHRLPEAVRCQFLRLRIDAAAGAFPTLREVEFYSRPTAKVTFPDWVLVVNTTDDPRLPNEGKGFIPLAKSCPGWTNLQAQQIWVGTFNEALVAAEPRPLCAFLSGNFKDWCQVNRETWRGTQQVLEGGHLPMWASCGGAQGLAILAETGVDRPWDCPHCRDPDHPKLPIYTHIGHTGKKPCGDYSACVFERGSHTVRQVSHDPAFRGLPREFKIVESHCGQIEWAPAGWELIATAGPGTLTKTQCLRVKKRCIYAAQFHIELPGEERNARRIMGNFLDLAKSAGGNIP
jgi:hypothetical protein